jgi:hypothetical protein
MKTTCRLSSYWRSNSSLNRRAVLFLDRGADSQLHTVNSHAHQLHPPGGEHQDPDMAGRRWMSLPACSEKLIISELLILIFTKSFSHYFTMLIKKFIPLRTTTKVYLFYLDDKKNFSRILRVVYFGKRFKNHTVGNE